MNDRQALAHCRQVLQRSGSSFALAFWLLPAGPRAAMTAFYAFCRLVDDAVDEAPDLDSARRRLELWRRRLDDIFTGGRPTHPVSRALALAVTRYGIRRQYLQWLLDGVEQDLVQDRYQTFSQLGEYCFRVAGTVGLVCLSVMGVEGARARRYAELSGLAVQMTNIIRDLGEDARRGRIYLPLEDLRRHKVSEEDLLQGRDLPAVRRLLAFQVERTRTIYRMASAWLPARERGRLFFAEALRHTYRQLLEQVAGLGTRVFDNRARLGKGRKLAIALRHRLLPAQLWSRS